MRPHKSFLRKSTHVAFVHLARKNLILGSDVDEEGTLAAVRVQDAPAVAMGSLLGHLMYGVILGLLFVRFRSGATVAAARPA